MVSKLLHAVFGVAAIAATPASAVLMQCYASRSETRCLPFGLYETLVECQKEAKEYSRFDSKALLAVNAPIVVGYHCLQEKRS